jgi:flagellar L-ring protein precursor FlgH
MPVLENSASQVSPSFVADRKAQRVGDLVTVLITEAASVSTSARTRAQKQEGATAKFDQLPDDHRSIGGNFQRDFSGGGQVERSGRLIARLATTVMEADGTGRLRISGEQRIVANNEEQVVSLEGYIRAEDIGPDNTIASQRVALARIELTGRGVLGRGQAPGWLTRLFMGLGQ